MIKDGVNAVTEDTAACGSEMASLKLQKSNMERNIFNMQKKIEKDGDKVDAIILECRLQILESYFKELCQIQKEIENCSPTKYANQLEEAEKSKCITQPRCSVCQSSQHTLFHKFNGQQAGQSTSHQFEHQADSSSDNHSNPVSLVARSSKRALISTAVVIEKDFRVAYQPPQLHIQDVSVTSGVHTMIMESVDIKLKAQPGACVEISPGENSHYTKSTDLLFSKPQPIDILLGTEVFFALFFDGLISFGDGMPCLTNIIFDWIVAGTSKSPLRTLVLSYNLEISLSNRQIERETISHPNKPFRGLHFIEALAESSKKSTKADFKILQSNTITYGLYAAPLLSIRILLFIAENSSSMFSRGSGALHEDFFIVDVINCYDKLKTVWMQNKDLAICGKIQHFIGAFRTTYNFDFRIWALGTYKSISLISKSKVATIKAQSLPRLKFCITVLLWIEVQQDILKVVSVYFWTYPENIRYWLKVHSSTLNKLVENRVSKILEESRFICWIHASSKSQSADIVARGYNAKELPSTIWFHGPTFIQENQSMWPKTEEEAFELPLECRKAAVFKCTDVTPSIVEEIIDKHISYFKFVRILAYVFRFFNRCPVGRMMKPKDLTHVQPNEFEHTFWRIATRIQDDIAAMAKGYIVQQKLAPVLHKTAVGNGFVIIPIPYDARFSALLPKTYRFVKLYIEYLHRVHLHAGPKVLLGILRKKKWVIDVVRGCTQCFPYKPKLVEQIIGNLTADRLPSQRLFLVARVDFCGPVLKSYSIRSKVPYKPVIGRYQTTTMILKLQHRHRSLLIMMIMSTSKNHPRSPFGNIFSFLNWVITTPNTKGQLASINDDTTTKAFGSNYNSYIRF